MTSLNISDADIPDLNGKVAVVTGGASGIGLAASYILSAHNARVYILDLNPPDTSFSITSTTTAPITPPNTSTPPLPHNIIYIPCSTAKWADLTSAFSRIISENSRIDIAIANAGVSEECDYFTDTFDEEGILQEPKWGVLDVNLRGTLGFLKLAISSMRKSGGGSLVITSSATAYSPEQSLPVYSSSKFALIGLIRSLRSTLPLSNITINGVAPAATITKLLPMNLATPLMAAGLPVSTAHFVGMALVYSATANQERSVEAYGKDPDEPKGGRWNGRVILTLGDKYTELEGPVASLKSQWFGKSNTELTRAQQKATDFRDLNNAA